MTRLDHVNAGVLMALSDSEKYSWWRVHKAWAAAIAVVVIVAVGVAFYTFWPRTPNPVYVTDGSVVFNANLASVEGKIKAENDWVTRQGAPYVSIAVLATMSPNQDVEPLDDNRTRHGVEGTYIAQYAANHPDGPTGRPGAPLIRLLLADEGSKEANWSQAAADLESRVDTSDHLVAVTGLGISVDNTKQLVARLADNDNLALVGDVVTGDDIHSAKGKGMVRVAPTDTAQAEAGLKFLDGNPDPAWPLPDSPGVWLVQDQNPADDYAISLGAKFQKALTDAGTRRQFHLVGAGTQYNSSLPGAPDALRDTSIGDRICNAHDDVVFFAGRGADFQGFLEGISHRYCKPSKHLIVLTGSDTTHLINHTGLWSGSEAQMSVYFTALAHPRMWTDQPNAVDLATAARFGSGPGHFATEFANESLDDGWAIMFQDGMLTAIDAAKRLFQLNGSIPPAGNVAQEINQVIVHGASGYICFDADHNPINKAIPILSVDQNGVFTFRQLSSASGTPPTNDACQ
jgi:hypothetical protein